MTIRVTIENHEAANGRTITVRYVDRPRLGHESETFAGDVQPGERREFTVHAARHLIVEEVP